MISRPLLTFAMALLLALPTSAAAASSDPTARAAADRVARDLSASGDTLPVGSDSVTLTLDAILLLAATGTSGDTATRAMDRVLDEQASYLAGAAASDMGRRAKLAFVLLVAGRDATAAPLLTDLRTSLQPSGRFGTTTNVFGQAFGVLALARTPEGVPASAASYLASLQCRTPGAPQLGGFGYGSCSSVDGDATGIAVSALLAAGTAPTDPLLVEARGWMQRTQLADGSFSMRMGGTTGNANSTGLVAHAARQLGGTDGTAIAAAGAAYVRELQVTCASPLRTSDDPASPGGFPTTWRGAIAYDAATQDDAIAMGIPSGQLTSWRYTTVQAALAMPTVRGYRDMTLADAERATTPLPACPVSALPPAPGGTGTGSGTGTGAVDDALPAARFIVRADRRPVSVGARTSVRVTGLAPREGWSIVLSGRVLARGIATASGTVQRIVVVPRTFGSHPRRILRVVVATPGRGGVTTLATAAPRILGADSIRTARAGSTLRLPIRGLLPGEPWSATISGRRVARGVTPASMRTVVAVRLPARATTMRLVVCGTTCARRATVRIRVTA